MGESALALITKLSTRPRIVKGLIEFETNSLRPREIIEITGEPATGKSLFLSYLIQKTIMPKELGGTGANAVLVDCEHHFNIFHLSSAIEYHADVLVHTEGMNSDEREEKIKDVVKQTLSRLHIFKCYDFDSMVILFHQLRQFLIENSQVSVIALDNIASFYWKECSLTHDYKKMDTFIGRILASFQNSLGEFHICLLFTRPSYFQTRLSQVELSSNLDLGHINTSINLRMKEKDRCVYTAEIRSNRPTRVLHFKANDGGLCWLNESGENIT